MSACGCGCGDVGTDATPHSYLLLLLHITCYILHAGNILIQEMGGQRSYKVCDFGVSRVN